MGLMRTLVLIKFIGHTRQLVLMVLMGLIGPLAFVWLIGLMRLMWPLVLIDSWCSLGSWCS